MATKKAATCCQTMRYSDPFPVRRNHYWRVSSDWDGSRRHETSHFDVDHRGSTAFVSADLFLYPSTRWSLSRHCASSPGKVWIVEFLTPRLHRAPIGNHPQRAVDIGTGTGISLWTIGNYSFDNGIGIWAIEFGQSVYLAFINFTKQ